MSVDVLFTRLPPLTPEPYRSTSENAETLEWWCGNRKLTLHCTQHLIEFVQVWGVDINSEMNDGVVNTPEEVLGLLQWVQDGKESCNVR